jgi:hypothetical protein
VQVYIYVEGRQTREQYTTNGSKPGSKVEHVRRESQKVPTVRRTSFSCRPVCNPRLSNFPFATFIPKFEFRFKLLTFLTSPFTRGLKLKTLTPLSSPKIKNSNETLIENMGFEHNTPHQFQNHPVLATILVTIVAHSSHREYENLRA